MISMAPSTCLKECSESGPVTSVAIKVDLMVDLSRNSSYPRSKNYSDIKKG